MVTERLGIIGGGQLAMMLADAGKSMGHRVVILAESESDPAISHADEAIIATFQDPIGFQKLFENIDVVAFESEFSSGPILKSVAANFPQLKGLHLDAMDQVADKLQQKRMLDAHNLPTAQYLEYSGSPKDWLSSVMSAFPNGSVLKWARGGYDGKGNFVFQNTDSALAKAVCFIEAGLQKNISIYAEELIHFNQELAVLTARSMSGQSQCYPTLLTKQQHGVCVETMGPAVEFEISTKAAEKAQEIAIAVGDIVGIHGVYAVEFFYTKDGKILVNEIAPRVHNSGHYTLGTTTPSQFTSHWEALMGRNLPTFQAPAFFGMLNILGPGNKSGPVKPCQVSSEGLYSYWYEKKESRPGRKLGHIAVEGSNREVFLRRLAMAREEISQWGATVF